MYPVKYFFISFALICCSVSIAQNASSTSADADYHYQGTLKINPESGHLAADWQITVFDTNETAATFLLRETLSDFKVSGAGVASSEIKRQSGFGEYWAVTVEFADSDQPRQIQISYNGILLPEPMENRINSITPDMVELNVDSFWFPIDQRFNKLLSVELAIDIGQGWQGVTTGAATTTDNGIKINNTDPRLDIAFAMSKSFHISRQQGFEIYDLREHRLGTDKLVNAALKCRDFLNTRFGKNNPLPDGRLLITERPSSGYARENYIVFTDIADTEPAPLMRFVCHEFAHYWSRGAKFDTVDNWINEGFAEYLGTMAVREYFGESAHQEMLEAFAEQIADQELPRIWREGDTVRGPYLVQYRKAPLLLSKLETALGREKFMRFLQVLLPEPVKTTESLLLNLEGLAGAGHREMFEQQLGE